MFGGPQLFFWGEKAKENFWGALLWGVFGDPKKTVFPRGLKRGGPGKTFGLGLGTGSQFWGFTPFKKMGCGLGLVFIDSGWGSWVCGPLVGEISWGETPRVEKGVLCLGTQLSPTFLGRGIAKFKAPLGKIWGFGVRLGALSWGA